MLKMPTLETALRSAVRTAIEQPREVPERPIQWLPRAESALANGDDAAIKVCCDMIAAAHSQYRADFDIKGWLYDLRNARLVESGRPDLVVQ